MTKTRWVDPSGSVFELVKQARDAAINSKRANYNVETVEALRFCLDLGSVVKEVCQDNWIIDAISGPKSVNPLAVTDIMLNPDSSVAIDPNTHLRTIKKV